MNRLLLSTFFAIGSLAPALANDSTAELGTGGLILSRNDVIQMESETLFISMDRVTVDYVFVNRSEEDIETIVAFPMPDIEGKSWSWPALATDKSDNFLSFEVVADGREIRPELEHKAIAVGIDVSADLAAQDIPLFPFGEEAYATVGKLPEDVLKDWVDRGIVQIMRYDDGSGWKSEVTPFWKLRSTYWWRMNFPARKPVKVSHRYLPSVGGSAGLTFFYDGKFQGDNYPRYKEKYCIDDAFERAVEKFAKQSTDGYPPLTETRISYVLTTGGNWALGTIGKFKLTIDKGEPSSIVSFCGLGTGVKKVGPSRFEMNATDYYPARDVDILVLQPYSLEPSAAKAGTGLSGAAARRKARQPPAGTKP